MSAVISEATHKRKFSATDSVLFPARNPSNKADTRLFKRIACQASITYEYYDPENFSSVDTFKMGTAKLCNYSSGGMCLAVKQPLKRYLPVFVRVCNATGVIACLGSKQGHHVEVIWCCRPRLQKTTDFRVGVRFYESPVTPVKHHRHSYCRLLNHA